MQCLTTNKFYGLTKTIITFKLFTVCKFLNIKGMYCLMLTRKVQQWTLIGRNLLIPAVSIIRSIIYHFFAFFVNDFKILVSSEIKGFRYQCSSMLASLIITACSIQFTS